jgi:hypothetical protein
MRVREPGTIPYNDELVSSSKAQDYKISFVSCGQKFECSLQVPLYMWDALASEDKDLVEKLVRERADAIRIDSARAGEGFTRWRENLKEFARKALYNQFMKRQVRVGNHEGHAVPLGW